MAARSGAPPGKAPKRNRRPAGTEAADFESGQLGNGNSNTAQLRPQQARRQRQIERLHQLGPRAVGELVAEIERHHPQIADDIDRRLAAYAERLNPDLLRATGGDRWPHPPLHAIAVSRP